MSIQRLLGNPYAHLLLNIAYAVGNIALGLWSFSWWFITVGSYFAVLAVTRFAVLKIRHKAQGDYTAETFARRITGVLLVVLSVCIAGMNVLSIVKDRGIVYHEIVMIAIAAYTFTKITIAIVEMVRAGRDPSPVVRTLRNLSLATAFVSVYTLQRSMLVSFPGMAAAEIQLFNILTGTAVWLLVLLLGINLIGGKYTDMAKSKIAKATQKMAETVTDGYKKIETGVVDGYKKIEKGVVDGYKKIEDKFVDLYLTREGETVEEAKERLKNEKHQ